MTRSISKPEGKEDYLVVIPSLDTDPSGKTGTCSFFTILGVGVYLNLLSLHAFVPELVH